MTRANDLPISFKQQIGISCHVSANVPQLPTYSKLYFIAILHYTSTHKIIQVQSLSFKCRNL